MTKTVPKPMVPVAGAPYLEHQLKLLERQGIRDILVLTGYLGEQIEDHFGDGARWNLSIQYSREETPMGTGGALRLAGDKLADSFLLIYGDSYLPIDYTQALSRLEQTGARGLLVVYDNRLADTTVQSNIDLDADGWVARYQKDSPDPLAYVDAGVLAFRKSVLDLIPQDGAVSLEKEIFPRLIAAREMTSLVTTQRFYDIGTPERLKVIEELLTK